MMGEGIMDPAATCLGPMRLRFEWGAGLGAPLGSIEIEGRLTVLHCSDHAVRSDERVEVSWMLE